MKKLLFLITTCAFLLGALTQAFAAPAQNASRGGGINNAQKSGSQRTQRATTQRGTSKASQRTTKTAKKPQQSTLERLQPRQAQAQAKTRAENRTKEFGLMPNEIDSTNHSTFHADAAAIRGARDTESALRYLPFVTIVNTAGFGQSFDLRGQGRLSANGVKLYLNGIPVKPVDNYFNPMPINTIFPQLIQEVSVTPGGGAVLYGSGAKGGTINIITSQRSDPYFMVGGGYTNVVASSGNSFHAYAQAAENFGPHFKANAGLAGSILAGPRTDDLLQNAQAVLGAWYDIGWGQSISVDADAFWAKNKTTPYNSLIDFANINSFMLGTISLPEVINGIQGNWVVANKYEGNRYQCLAGNSSDCAYGSNDFTPSKSDRATPGYGSIETTQLRATAKVDYLAQLTQKLKFEGTAFGHFTSMKYDKHKMNLPYFVLGYQDPTDKSKKGYNWFLPRPNSPIRPDLPEAGYFLYGDGESYGDGERADWHLLDQTGSKFDDYKFGGKARIDWLHDKGEFIFGADIFYEMSKKDSKTYLRQAIVDGSVFGGFVDRSITGAKQIKYDSGSFSALQANILEKQDINVFTAAVYMYERYDFNRNFSVGAGARYESKIYDVKITDDFYGKKLVFNNTQDTKDKNGDDCKGNGSNNNCDYVDYDNSNFNTSKNNANRGGQTKVVNGVMEITKRDGTKWGGDNTAKLENVKGKYNKNHDNFVFELAPVYRYSNTGAIYARGEFGYTAPPAWAVLRRIGVVWGATKQSDIRWMKDANSPVTIANSLILDFDFEFEDTNLKNETYYTAELGWSETIGTRRVPLGITNLTLNALLFSANVFYTQSQNEFYFEGDTWSGMHFGNYDKSRRFGVELAAEQYLFDGALGLNESFTYLKAEKFDCGYLNALTQKCETGNEWQPIPYTYDWKATLGAAVNVATFLEVIDVDISVWLQNSLYGNQHIYAQRMKAITKNPANSKEDIEPVFYAEKEEKTLNPYVVSDFGVSVGLNKNMGVITVGIKNIFDTFYYDYYNNDRSAVVNENRYVIGRGRTVFLEGTFRY